MNSRTRITWIVLPGLLLALYSDNEAYGKLSLETWRDEVTTERSLAEGDISCADSEVTRLQREFSSQALNSTSGRKQKCWIRTTFSTS